MQLCTMHILLIFKTCKNNIETYALPCKTDIFLYTRFNVLWQVYA